MVSLFNNNDLLSIKNGISFQEPAKSFGQNTFAVVNAIYCYSINYSFTTLSTIFLLPN